MPQSDVFCQDILNFEFSIQLNLDLQKNHRKMIRMFKFWR